MAFPICAGSSVSARCRPVRGTSHRVLPRHAAVLKRQALLLPVLQPRRCVRVGFKPDLTSDASTASQIALPFGYPQLLGFAAGAEPKDSDVNAAFDDISSTVPVSGYSDTTVYGRNELLRMAKRLILDSKARRTSTTAAPLQETTLPLDMVPAALALLAEVGQCALVLDLGQQLLASPELAGSDEAHDDILLSMALSYCDMARTALEAGEGSHNQASLACMHLEEALQLLHSAAQPPLAPALVGDIQSGLRRLRAPSIQEELLGSSNAATKRNAASIERRKRALRSLKELLKDASLPSSSKTSSGMAGPAVLRLGNFLRGTAAPETGSKEGAKAAADASQALPQSTVRQLMATLSCEEVVHLMEWDQVARSAASCPWLYQGLLHTVAAGHIVMAYRQRQPAYVKQAAVILKQLPQTARVLAMQGACQLLLGSVQQSIQLLKQAEAVGLQGEENDGEVYDADERWGWGAYQYVAQNSPEGEDGLLPGLCAWTELWLKKVAFQLFADASTTPPSASLSKYFDDTRVEALIEVYDEKGAATSGPAGRAMETMTAALQDAQGALSAAAAPSAGSLASRLASLNAATPGAKLVLAAGIALAAFGVATIGSLLLGGGRGLAGAGVGVSTPWSRGATADQVSPLVCDSIDAATGEQLIRSWQVAKQLCLGSGHDMSPLPVVLTGHALGEAQQRSLDFNDRGCYMQYKLWKCQVTDVRPCSRGGMQLTALLDESASMLSHDNRARDFYRSTYEARYQAVKSRDGAWRIARITVVGEGSAADQS